MRSGTSPIGSGKPEQVREAVQAAMENLRREVDVSGAHIECGPVPAVNVEKHALQQLFQNLLSNAMKYRKPDASPMIRIAAAYKAPMWEFTVSDNAIGIAPEWHERIFQPMQRIHGLEIAGSGIGLATCKKIVTRSGGVIWVDSEPGVGSTFHFTLPGPAPVKADEATV